MSATATVAISHKTEVVVLSPPDCLDYRKIMHFCKSVSEAAVLPLSVLEPNGPRIIQKIAIMEERKEVKHIPSQTSYSEEVVGITRK